MLECYGEHRLNPYFNGAELPGRGSFELLAGAGLEVIFSRDVRLLVGYERTAIALNHTAVNSFTVTIVPLVL